MMTALEERLSREGATPAQYQQWQQEAQALEAALSILDTLKGAC